jgi:uncharacterized protein
MARDKRGHDAESGFDFIGTRCSFLFWPTRAVRRRDQLLLEQAAIDCVVAADHSLLATRRFSAKLGEFLMIGVKHVTLGLILAAIAQSTPVWTAEPAPEGRLRIDVPVTLKPSKVVFNMDHLAFDGDRSIGLNYMKLMAQSYKASQTPISIIAVFHGAAGYMLLNDQAYNAARTSDKGNPFKEQIAVLQQEGVQFEECGETARRKGWVNADLLPGVKVDTGANLRIVQLVQDGYVQLQP